MTVQNPVNILSNEARNVRRSKKSVDLSQFQNILPTQTSTTPSTDIGSNIEMNRYRNIFSTMQPRTYNPQVTAGNYNPQGNTATPSMFTNLGRISTMPGEQTRYEQYHAGIDLAAPTGTPVTNFVSGTVTDVGYSPSAWGNYVIVKDKIGNKQRYSHLSKSFVPVGTNVKSGQEIGLMGTTGAVYSPSGKGDPSHLDYRIQDAYGKYVNPIVYVNQYGNQ